MTILSICLWFAGDEEEDVRGASILCIEGVWLVVTDCESVASCVVVSEGTIIGGSTGSSSNKVRDCASPIGRYILPESKTIQSDETVRKR